MKKSFSFSVCSKTLHKRVHQSKLLLSQLRQPIDQFLPAGIYSLVLTGRGFFFLPKQKRFLSSFFS